jgi:hypothetical protein
LIKTCIILLCTLLFFATSACADLLADIKSRYSSEAYLVGIGLANSSGNPIKDRRCAEIFARLEIAKSIKVTIQEKSVDLMCSQQEKGIYADRSECRNEFSMIVQESVDQVLEGSRIVETIEDKSNGVFYAVAILPRLQAAQKAEKAVVGSRADAELHLDRAKSAISAPEKIAEISRAKEDFKKVIAYESEKSAIQKSASNADEMFGQILSEIGRVEAE